MNKFSTTCIIAVCALSVLTGISEAGSDKPRKARHRATEVIRDLTGTGEKLEAKYALMQKSLEAEIVAALPEISDAEQSALLKAFEAENETAQRVESHRKKLWRMRKPVNELEELQQAGKHFDYTMRMDQDALKRALALPDDHPGKAEHIQSMRKRAEERRKEVNQSLERIEKLQNRIAELQEAIAEGTGQYEAAVEQHEQAKAKTRRILDALPLDGVLSGKIDTQLATYMIITEATPRKLAEYAQQGPEQQQVVEQLFSDAPLMVQMLVADGAVWGKYGQAMELYNAIRQASDKARDGVLQRLALAVALTHAVPIRQENPEALKDGPEFVNPIQRHLSYERAYLGGELDPSFEDHSVWSLKMVVGGEYPDETIAWGREMFRNYRPDLLKATLDEGRYVNIVDNEISYTSKRVKFDKPQLQKQQNILNNGGICGRRAFFARFLLRSFGVPTTARPQKGHAALVHYAPGGWTPRLGGGWGAGARSVGGLYHSDLDFQDSTQARQAKEDYLTVKRAQWIARATGEQPVYGLSRKSDAGFWNSVALIEQQRLADAFEATAVPETSEVQVVTHGHIPEEARTITVDSDGVITIPAVATAYPTRSTKQSSNTKISEAITFMESSDGGWQLHFSKNAGWGPSYQYVFDAPNAGEYQLTAKVVTPGKTHPLNVSVNDSTATEMPLPDTVGLWQTSKPITIELVHGRNTLTFFGPYRGIIKEFKLTPDP